MHAATNDMRQEEADLELVGKFRETKDMAVLGQLWSRNLPLMLSVCMKYLGNRDNAKDACNEIFLELNDKILRHEMKKFRPWLYVLVKNHCLQRVRRDQRMQVEDLDEKKIDQVHVEFPKFEHLPHEGVSLELKLKSSMEKLNPSQRQCLELFYYQERSYRDIAAITGLEPGLVKSHIQNGKRNLLMDLGPHSSLLS